MKVEMTGRQDREGPWNIAVCGHPGVGKTLFSSTAPDPLFLFFKDNPPLKSVADRYIPHVKITNVVNDDGTLEVGVLDQLLTVIQTLELRGPQQEYKTLVLDTGNELFTQMKDLRRLQNGGEFEIGDWGWIADAFREVITHILDLPLNVIVLFHLKANTDDEGRTFKEIMLQGQAKDEAPSWFDVVGVIESVEVETETGLHTKRSLLTSGSRMYPWLKDHSGSLPQRFPISDDFAGDWQRMYDILIERVPSEDSSMLLDMDIPGDSTPKLSLVEVPTPEEVDEKKSLKETIIQKNDTKQDDSAPEDDGVAVSSESEPVQQAIDILNEELPGGVTEVDSSHKCEQCGALVEDETIRDISMARHNKVFCRPCYIEQRNG